MVLAWMWADALAWKHTGNVWETMPVAVCIEDLAGDAVLAADAALAIDAWNDVLVAEGLGSLVEDCTTGGGITVVLWSDEEAETVTNGVTKVDHCSYGLLESYTSHTAKNVDYGTHDEIAGGQCGGQTNIRGVVAHLIGHGLGLGHSCDDGEVCNDPALLGAVMYWTSPACDTLVEPQPDDIAGLSALYGAAPTCDPGLPAGTGTGTGSVGTSTGTPGGLDGDSDGSKGGCSCATGTGWSLGWMTLLPVALWRRERA